MTSPKPPARSKLPFIIAGVVAAAIAAAVAIGLLGGGSSEEVATEVSSGGRFTPIASVEGSTVITAPVTVTGAVLAPLQGGADTTIGTPFPELGGQSLFDGEPLTVTNDGNPKLILYVAHWCPHCQREVPRVEEYLKTNQPEGVDFYAVSTAAVEARGNYPPVSWLTKENWPVPTLADDATGTAFAAAGGTGFPFFVAVDRDGNVMRRASGELSEDALALLISDLQSS